MLINSKNASQLSSKLPSCQYSARSNRNSEFSIQIANKTIKIKLIQSEKDDTMNNPLKSKRCFKSSIAAKENESNSMKQNCRLTNLPLQNPVCQKPFQNPVFQKPLKRCQSFQSVFSEYKYSVKEFQNRRCKWGQKKRKIPKNELAKLDFIKKEDWNKKLSYQSLLSSK